MLVSDDARLAFYRASTCGLAFLDASSAANRRFGPDADARWSSFAGHLGLRDRLDILLRDAAVSWRSAFSPAQVFSLAGLADDESFGPDWTGLTEAEARQVFADGRSLDVGSFDATLELTLGALSFLPLPAAPELGELTPATRLLVHGPASLVAVARQFAARDDLSWSDQIVVVADAPRERQLAGLLALLIGAGSPTKLVSRTKDAGADPQAVVKAAGLPSIDRAVIDQQGSASGAAAWIAKALA